MSPLQLKIEFIPSKLAMNLNKLWHSRMPRIDAYNVCRPCFGAYYKNICFAVAMWSLPIAANRIKNGNRCLELRRMAISPEAPKNTASRMIKIMSNLIFNNMSHIFKLISYQDTGVHLGTIYKASGWVIGRHGKYQTWGIHTKRPGRIEQSKSDKIRWEKQIRKEPIVEKKEKPTSSQLKWC